MPRLISERVLTGRARDEGARQEAVRDIEAETDRARQGGGFDIDTVLDADLTEPSGSASPLTMDDLGRVISTESLLPPGLKTKPMSQASPDSGNPAWRMPCACRPTRSITNRMRIHWSLEPRQSDISGTGGRGGSTARCDPERDLSVRGKFAVDRRPGCRSGRRRRTDLRSSRRLLAKQRQGGTFQERGVEKARAVVGCRPRHRRACSRCRCSAPSRSWNGR